MSAQKILIVEDDDSLLKVLTERLRDEGFEVSTAMNGLDGLIAALEHKPHLILLDVMIPDLDGIKLLKKLRETAYGKTVGVILLTALSDPNTMHQLVELGVEDYMVKGNWTLQDIVATVRAYFTSRKAS